MLGVAGPCNPEALAALQQATASAEVFNLSEALHTLNQVPPGCVDVEAAAIYVRGLLSAREAARLGGTVDSLVDVRSAVNELARLTNPVPPQIEIAQLVLQAAAAAAQSERQEMAVFLDQATRLEALQRAAGQPGAPLVSAHEVAGELWLQVHGYDDARRAFVRAAEQVGQTGRVRLGWARAAVGLKDSLSACAEYRRVDEWWGSRTATPPEITETRLYLQSRECASPRP
jgi:hypothetical protein